MRSYVVKPFSHFRHSRRRRMESASLLSRESTTLSFSNPQKGNFMRLVSLGDKHDCSRQCARGTGWGNHDGQFPSGPSSGSDVTVPGVRRKISKFNPFLV